MGAKQPNPAPRERKPEPPPAPPPKRYELAGTEGVVTLAQWTMAPNGQTYLYAWCADWRIVPDNAMPVEGFRSSEHWQLWGFVGDRCVVMIPGCQVKGWIRCAVPPNAPGVMVFA